MSNHPSLDEDLGSELIRESSLDGVFNPIKAIKSVIESLERAS